MAPTSQPQPAPVAPPPAPEPKRADNLPLVFQEVFTVIVRMRAQRQRVGEPEAFRSQMRAALKNAEQEGLRRGYTLEDLRVATFAVVAFLDETILNSQNPIFADWPRMPMQEEMFGVHIAGEIFFRNVERLLGRQDSEALADLLEVHQICLLLGFRGRFSASGIGEIRAILSQIEEKIRRIRQGVAPPIAQIEPQVVKPPSDRWITILKWVAIGSGSLAILLFIIFKLVLGSAAGELQAIAARIPL
ncbi:MAG TPA: DotU family type IV/VI secretion system protein [Bryobacteraceae bacterium]|nr:DotU family type IV/VI secretion system protein [Bryobacteraceae bacterium]